MSGAAASHTAESAWRFATLAIGGFVGAVGVSLAPTYFWSSSREKPMSSKVGLQSKKLQDVAKDLEAVERSLRSEIRDLRTEMWEEN